MHTLTQANATVLQQVVQVVKHGALILSADSAEVTQETTAVGHHLREPDLLKDKHLDFCLLCRASGCASYELNLSVLSHSLSLLVCLKAVSSGLSFSSSTVGCSFHKFGIHINYYVEVHQI